MNINVLLIAAIVCAGAVVVLMEWFSAMIESQEAADAEKDREISEWQEHCQRIKDADEAAERAQPNNWSYWVPDISWVGEPRASLPGTNNGNSGRLLTARSFGALTDPDVVDAEWVRDLPPELECDT